MSQDVRTFATLDTCPQCGGVFAEMGEGITALKHETELSDLVANGKADMVGVSTIACPSGHGIMTVYRVKGGPDALEVDVCPTCGGVFFDAGEAELFGELAKRSDELVTASGARFSAPPRDSKHDAVVEERRAQGGSAFSAFFEAMTSAAIAVGRSSVRHHAHRIRHRH
jgi:Zn-finger nucleic acid-binding protein